MRVTRQRAARERQALQQQQQQQTDIAAEPMAVEPAAFTLDPLTQRDPQLCHHYTKEIYSYLRALELEHRVSPHFMQVREAPHRVRRRRRLAPPASLDRLCTSSGVAAGGGGGGTRTSCCCAARTGSLRRQAFMSYRSARSRSRRRCRSCLRDLA